jgi:hypothetical protein
MKYLIDGEDFYLGSGLVELDPADYIVTRKGSWGAGTPTPEQEAYRIKCMTEAWQCPVKKAAQSERTKKNHRNHDPVVRAKRSASMKAHCSTPEAKARLSAQKKAYWDNWRAERGLPPKASK